MMIRLTKFSVVLLVGGVQVDLTRTIPPFMSSSLSPETQMVFPCEVGDEVALAEKIVLWYTTVRGTQLIQTFFSEFTAEQREFILSGTTPEEWNKMFGPETCDVEAS